MTDITNTNAAGLPTAEIAALPTASVAALATTDVAALNATTAPVLNPTGPAPVVAPPSPAHPLVQMNKVESSQIAAIGHDNLAHRLIVRFKNGAEYAYENVTKDIHEAIMNAKAAGASVGTKFNELVKNEKEKFPFSKL